MAKIKIASLQLKVYEDKYENIEKLAEIIGSGAAEGADIISLPEIWNSPYQTDLFPVNAEPEQGDSWLALSTIARKNHVYMVGGSIPELGEDGKVCIDQEKCVGCGICKARCDVGAIQIKQTMPMRKDLHEYFLKDYSLDLKVWNETQGD